MDAQQDGRQDGKELEHANFKVVRMRWEGSGGYYGCTAGWQTRWKGIGARQLNGSKDAMRVKRGEDGCTAGWQTSWKG